MVYKNHLAAPFGSRESAAGREVFRKAHTKEKAQHWGKAHTAPCIAPITKPSFKLCCAPNLHSKCHRMTKSRLEIRSIWCWRACYQPSCIQTAFKMLNFFRCQLTNCIIIQGGRRKYCRPFKTLQYQSNKWKVANKSKNAVWNKKNAFEWNQFEYSERLCHNIRSL